MRTGIGYDSHRLVEGRRLVLGGVDIPYDRGLQGHSDADVLTHAVMDALLGAAGLGDIGQHFPDDDDHFKDADSIELLKIVCTFLETAGFTLEHVDTILMVEAPKLAPHRDAIRASLAAGLDLPLANVNVKFTTGEGMGFVGRGEGVAALAIASVRV